METQEFWKTCSSCKKQIGFSQPYYLCSVSTCRHKRTGLRFCSVSCWDMHLAYANHRESWAEEAQSPSKEQHSSEQEAQKTDSSRSPRRIIVDTPKTEPSPTESPTPQTDLKNLETLVVVSKLKKLVKERTGLNTSQCGIDALTTVVAKAALEAAERAKKDERKTLMGRDFT